MHRFFVSKPDAINGETVFISRRRDLLHMVQVLRFKADDHLLVFDPNRSEHELSLFQLKKAGLSEG